jgi:prepilin-type N-terminal cleavage/methylation domain-containing protein
VSSPYVHHEEGFSLAELLVTIVIVGVTFTALLGGR